MSNSYYTPLYSALYKKQYVLGVSGKLFALELAISGLVALVFALYLLLLPILFIHVSVAVLNKKEPEWIEITKFLMKVPNEESAHIS